MAQPSMQTGWSDGSRVILMTDVTIVGSGIAGLFVTLKCAREGLKGALAVSYTNLTLPTILRAWD